MANATFDAIKIGIASPEMIRESRYHDAKRCAQITKELMELPDRPTCVIFPDDYSYIGAGGNQGKRPGDRRQHLGYRL